MRQNEQILLKKYILTANTYLELGSGGSTIAALINSKGTVYSVDSNLSLSHRNLDKRMFMNYFFKILCAFFLFGLFAPVSAHAYIDPGLGSMLLQGLAAGAISFLVFWGRLRRKIVSFFSRGRKEKNDEKS
jgi:hypothetical protein